MRSKISRDKLLFASNHLTGKKKSIGAIFLCRISLWKRACPYVTPLKQISNTELVSDFLLCQRVFDFLITK